MAQTTQKARERWCDLTVIMSWQLWLARLECIDTPLPWQSTQQTLSPSRVAQAFPSIITVIGTMAKLPKTRGKSPGRQKGHFPLFRPKQWLNKPFRGSEQK